MTEKQQAVIDELHGNAFTIEDSLRKLRPFMSREQYLSLLCLIRESEEATHYEERIIALKSLIDTMPKSYEQDGKGDQAIAYLHYFRGGADFFITEKDMEGSGTDQAFGLASMGGGFGPELNCISIREIIDAGVELDLYWTPKPLSECRNAPA